MQFNSAGATKFGDLTNKMAQTAQITGQDQLLAIVLDGEVQSAPAGAGAHRRQRRDHRQLHPRARPRTSPWSSRRAPAGRPEGRLAEQIGAVLGKASLRQALVAGAIGLLLILIFMIALYRLLGVIADIALIIYGVLFWGILNAIGVTMTLPGIAGMILTLGMAVDANVLIFSRIRDEVAHGKTMRTAFDAGYKKALRSIFDCNITTMITAAVLFWAASGGVRGFALTLAIGVLLSMFTAIVIVQAMLHLLAETSLFKNLRPAGPQTAYGERLMTVYPLMRYRWYYLVSLGVVTVFALLMVFVYGLNLGIEFHGGVRAEIKLNASAPSDKQVADLRAALATVGVTGAVVQPAGGKGGYLVTAEAMTDQQFKDALAKLDPAYGAQSSAAGIERVGPSFGAEMKQRVLLAILIDFLAMIVYISFRFNYKFAIPAIVALLHDVGLTLGIYAVTGRLVTTATVAAVLTILGYSMHDTIIVFDRIRENTPLMKKEILRRDGRPLDPPDDGAVDQHLGHGSVARRQHPAVRRRDAQGLRVRTTDRHRVRYVLVVLRRLAAPGHLERARAPVPSAPRGGAEGLAWTRREPALSGLTCLRPKSTPGQPGVLQASPVGKTPRTDRTARRGGTR